jgi:hypothetical protein
MPPSTLQSFTPLFAAIQSRFAAQNHHGLICKQGFYNGCPVLKLQKPHWTNDPMDQVRNTSGIFFSIWLDKNSLAHRRAHYNTHALKLRQLQGYALTSRAFAVAFRRALAPARHSWPNVRTDYGPLTLMQGWFPLDPSTFAADALSLLTRFTHLAPILDQLLASHRR